MNACLAMCFEATNLICHYDDNKKHQIEAATLMGKLIDPGSVVHSASLSTNPNVRFLALESLASLAQTQFAREGVRESLPEVLASLKSDARDDPTVHRKAVDVLYNSCDSETVETVVKDLLLFLKRSDYSIREEVVLKIAILAEKYASDLLWYVHVILTLIRIAGDHVTEEVWHRVLQIIVARPEVQAHAAKSCFEELLKPTCHEAMVKVGAYILGEFGHLIANDPLCVPEKQLDVLQSHYPMVSTETRGLLLSTFVKHGVVFPEMKETLDQVFASDNVAKSADADIQQRAVEYRKLLKLPDKTLNTVLDEMPAFPEKESTSALAKLERGTAAAEDAVGRARLRPRGDATPAAAAGADAASEAGSAPTSETVVNNDAFLPKFVFEDSGVLYENPVLQIGCKGLYLQPTCSAQLTVFYGNRSDTDMFTDVSARLYAEEEASFQLHAADLETTDLKPSQQVQQVIKCNVLTPFKEPPVLECILTYNKTRRIKVVMKLPILPNKLFGPLPNPLDASAFAKKWGEYAASEHVQDVTTKSALALGDLKNALEKFKLPVTDGIDPNPENCVCTAVWTLGGNVTGVLLRIERNDKACRVTVRSTAAGASPHIAKALCNMLALR
mmetsp:Transcript_24169/g.63073  ORF Transcript_24169/g.63073 Transcript_24169/m.63073 type:complete len:616 (-) Transcript_24169:48-1895(-)